MLADPGGTIWKEHVVVGAQARWQIAK